MDDRTAIETASHAFLDHWMGMSWLHQWLRETTIPWKDLVLPVFMQLGNPKATVCGPLLRLDDEVLFSDALHTFVQEVPDSVNTLSGSRALDECLNFCQRCPPSEYSLHAILIAHVGERSYTLLVELEFPHTEPLPSDPLPSDLN